MNKINWNGVLSLLLLIKNIDQMEVFLHQLKDTISKFKGYKKEGNKNRKRDKHIKI